MRPLYVLLSLLLLPLLAVQVTTAQWAPPVSAATVVPRAISFSGFGGASDAELLSASGLKAGEAISSAQIQAATQRLIDTGMFANALYKFDGVELHFDLTPATNLVPAKYENFPWWDDPSLTALLTKRIPLFHGLLPPQSGMQQEIVEMLTKLLAEQQITATVSAAPLVGLNGGEANGVNFRIDSPSVQIGTVSFEGTGGNWNEALSKIAKASLGQDYAEESAPLALRDAALAVLTRQGYVEAKVPRIAPQAPVFDGTAVQVPVTMTIEPCTQFKLGHFSLAGSVLMSESDFVKTAPLKQGDLADADKLRLSLRLLSSPYISHGYLRAKVRAAATLHHELNTVDYAITVEPGEVFHMGSLKVDNLDPERAAAFSKTWKMMPGDVYDASYAPNFLKKNASALHSLDDFSAIYKQIEHEDTHVVDLVVSFRKGGPVS